MIYIMKNRVLSLSKFLMAIYLAVLVLSLSYCSKEDGTLIYLGKWEYESSNPEVDLSYRSSYIEIFEDKSFVIFDSSIDRLIKSGANRVSSTGLVFTDPQTGESVTFSLKGIKDNRLTISTDYFGIETRMVLKRTLPPPGA